MVRSPACAHTHILLLPQFLFISLAVVHRSNSWVVYLKILKSENKNITGLNEYNLKKTTSVYVLSTAQQSCLSVKNHPTIFWFSLPLNIQWPLGPLLQEMEECSQEEQTERNTGLESWSFVGWEQGKEEKEVQYKRITTNKKNPKQLLQNTVPYL